MQSKISTGRIDLRVDEHKKQVITRAAKLSGQNLTQYVMGLIWPDASRRVADETRLTLSSKDWQEFCRLLDAPPRELPELKALLHRPTPFRNA